MTHFIAKYKSIIQRSLHSMQAIKSENNQLNPGDLVELGDWNPNDLEYQIKHGVVICPLGGGHLVLVGAVQLIYRDEDLTYVA